MRVLTLLLILLAAPALAAERVTVGGFDFAVPDGWQVVEPSSPMRQAQLAVPNPGGADGLVTFFHFGAGRGGSAEANIERWRRQFQDTVAEPAIAREQRGATVAHRFAATGTYLSGMPGGPRTAMPDTTLLAAVLEGERGNVFVRFVAPAALATAQESSFDALIGSATGR